MRYIRYAILAVFLLVMVLVALANRTVIEVALLPDELPYADMLKISVPMFVLIFAAIGVGLLLGYFLEFFREHKFRRRAAVKSREVARLDAEVKKLKQQGGRDDDDILALLN